MRHNIWCVRSKYTYIHTRIMFSFPKYMCSYLGHKDVIITIEVKSPWDNDLIEPTTYILGGSAAPKIEPQKTRFFKIIQPIIKSLRKNK